MGLIPAHAGKTRDGEASGERDGAHPRSRGENLRLYGLGALNEGSSPLTRGKPLGAKALHGAAGLIPAHAGKTPRPRRRRGGWTAHPRSRGENRGRGRHQCLRSGSSPLTRGKHEDEEFRVLAVRLIPAHAGKTPDPEGSHKYVGAHPRSRGENGGRPASRTRRMGSSPLTRGKPCCSLTTLVSIGLIPAHAGKTWPWPRPCRLRGAHPRSRGENIKSARGSVIDWGSSPLTRGKRAASDEKPARGRLIPAHAGKTPRWSPRPPGRPAHPRSRGENQKAAIEEQKGKGSSPLTRGKRPRLGLVGHQRRLIPAHAGKTGGGVRCVHRRRAHPRSRGENRSIMSRAESSHGSSPLTRGKHFLTCAFIAQIDQILESLELCAFSESYSSQDVYATDAPRDRVRSIGLAPRSSRGAS